MSLWKSLKRLDRRIAYVVVGLLAIGLAYGFGKILSMPPFMNKLSEGLEENDKLMRFIGSSTGQTLHLSQEVIAEGDSATFSVAITGECDSAYIKLRGIYYKKDRQLYYRVTDTTQVNACK
ncbi:hypothetical protein [Hymenobacter wooponensis]|uniref:Uncharacterized protein n=1 Tax=Hymenobacter wooponensis TaxID=1525360 RepID=A0A4Z0MDP9_9BACT|nr:hypothetical protein [Hymenobacter wooponensis]TGD77631.1 hypothetical protein EU557_22920 [Hymenobacter wooponensis]